jgi:hypothetical protein
MRLAQPSVLKLRTQINGAPVQGNKDHRGKPMDETPHPSFVLSEILLKLPINVIHDCSTLATMTTFSIPSSADLLSNS